MGEVCFCLLGRNGFHVLPENERFAAVSLRCGQKLKCGNFTSSFGRLIKQQIKEHAAHALCIFLTIRRIKFVICGITVAAAGCFFESLLLAFMRHL